MTPQDYSHETAVHPSRAVRVALVVAGIAFVGLGILGAFLPVLPTTPFMLLAAACFARSSPRFHQWLLRHRTFGPIVSEWERHRAIPYRTKIWAIVLMSATLAVSIAFFVKPLWLKAALAAFGVFMAIWLYRRPSRDHPRGR